MDFESWNKLRNLVSAEDYAGAAKLLSTSRTLLNARNSIGETVLHHLAVENRLEAVQWLFAQGFSLNPQNKAGNPPIFEVGLLGYKELLRWFVQNGADLSLRNAEGHDIWDHLADYNCKKTIVFLRTLGA